MANKYLTKIAKNRFEQYLADQPESRVFDNPAVDKAHKAIHASDRAKRLAAGVHAVGGKKEAVKKYLDESRDILRNHRGKPGLTERGAPDPTFYDRHRSAIPSQNLTERLKQHKKSKGILGSIKRNPKTALGIAAGVGLAGYGIKNLVSE